VRPSVPPRRLARPPKLPAMRDIERRSAESAPRSHPAKLPAKVYGVMAATTMLTFASLTTGYQLLFPPHQMIA
jgi:hypothetical protein